MTALDRLIPEPRLREVDDVTVFGAPEHVWRRIRHGDLGGAPLARALFAIRTLPDRLAGGPVHEALRLDDVVSTPQRPGFALLVDDPPHEVAAGACGEVWRLRIPFGHVEGVDAFAAHDEPGHVRVAWAFRVEPADAPDASRVTLELRVDATDEHGWRRFVPYWAAIGAGSRVIRRSLLAGLARELGSPEGDGHHPAVEAAEGVAVMAGALATPFLRDRRSHWGVSAELAAAPHPGDELVPEPRWGWTHGVEIDAPAAAVWPWVAQLGADRGGFYSYEWLENLVGCELRNAERIHPDWALQAGDELKLHPDQPGLPVVAVEPGRHLLAHADGADPSYPAVTWLFELTPLPGGRSRLVSRFRCGDVEDRPARATSGPLFLEPIGFAMDRAMLRGIRVRAERVSGRAAAGTALT